MSLKEDFMIFFRITRGWSCDKITVTKMCGMSNEDCPLCCIQQQYFCTYFWQKIFNCSKNNKQKNVLSDSHQHLFYYVAIVKKAKVHQCAMDKQLFFFQETYQSKKPLIPLLDTIQYGSLFF